MHFKTGPLVSVIVPVHNGETFIAEALNSLSSQSYSNIEIIVINDHSTDQTVSIVESLSDSRISLIDTDHKSRGIVGALNTGLATAKGDFVARMDADDICEPSRIEQQVRYMLKHVEVSVCGSRARKFGSSKGAIRVPVSNDHIRTAAVFHSPFTHPSIMIRKSTLDATGLQYEYGFELAEDYRLWTQLLKIGDGYNFRNKLLRYRVHQNQHSLSDYESRKDSVARIQSAWLKHCGLTYSPNALDLHVSLVTDVTYLARNPSRRQEAFNFYKDLYRENLNAKAQALSLFWLFFEISRILFLQGAFHLAVKLGLRKLHGH